ncbi:MAG: ABC transporter substrate-binding protein [Betaproteobacteria bacterium]
MIKSILKKMLTTVLLVTSVYAFADDNKITIMVSSIEKQIYLPAKLAEQLGYLKETGLEIELLSTATGSSAEKEMLSGVAQGVIGFYDHAIHLQARGKLVQSVVQFSQAPGEVLLVSKAAGKNIKSPADLKNKTVGVTGLGSSTHLLTQYLLTKSGLKNSDYFVLPVGAGSRFIAAINQGKIDAGMTTEPTISRLLSSGEASILIDLRTVSSTEAVLGGAYPGACLYMPTAWVSKNKETVQKIVNAFVKTLSYIQTHSAAEIAEMMPAEYYGSDKKSYIEALEISKRMFTPDGVMPKNGPPTVLRALKDFDKAVQGKPINLGNTFTNEFVNAAR